MPRQLTEQVFFYGLLALAGYVIWQIFAPFVGELILAAIIAVVAYPLFTRLLRVMPKQSRGLAAFATLILIACTIFAPLSFLAYILFNQALAFYNSFGQAGVASAGDSLNMLEGLIRQFFPDFAFNFAQYAKSASGWVAVHVGDIFAGTASTIFSLFITFIALFYMFKDGSWFVRKLICLSPLKDTEDTLILGRLTTSIRSVVLGTLAVALIQGILTSIGFTIFGIEQAVLWGSVAAVGALIPGIGTGIVFIVVIAITFLSGSYGAAIGLALWGIFAVGLIDNFLGPYLMGRGAELHPFLILIAVLGGVSLFGPIGILIGPVALTFFTVLLELYSLHTQKKDEERYAG
jgi:predicted PurR-regulated permease PerM